jgi:hypothetical protein
VRFFSQLLTVLADSTFAVFAASHFLSTTKETGMSSVNGTRASIAQTQQEAVRNVSQEAQEVVDLCEQILASPGATGEQKELATEALSKATENRTGTEKLLNDLASIASALAPVPQADGTTADVYESQASEVTDSSAAYLNNLEAELQTVATELAEADQAAAQFDELMSDPDKLLDLYNDDPAAFNEFYKGLSSDDRQALMTRLNREMQSNQQMMSLISNLMQASHQTSRAIIQNLRV